MNKRQTRFFAIGCTAFATVLFLGLTVDSHRQFAALTHEDKLTPEVIHGKDVWHKYNCINCHTLFGEGAYYAPDLTKITKLRGRAYLEAYLKDPAQFYDEQKHRRLMPKQDLSPKEITDVVTFLDWVSEVDNNGWPPRPLLVSGASIPGTDMTRVQQANLPPQDGESPPGSRPVAGDENPIALGENVFRSAAPPCNTCHSVAPGVNLVGPSLAGISGRAQKLIGSAEYKGKATDVAGYIKESILSPSAHLVPGAMYSANDVSFMPNTYETALTPEHLDQLVAYLSTLK